MSVTTLIIYSFSIFNRIMKFAKTYSILFWASTDAFIWINAYALYCFRFVHVFIESKISIIIILVAIGFNNFISILFFMQIFLSKYSLLLFFWRVEPLLRLITWKIVFFLLLNLEIHNFPLLPSLWCIGSSSWVDDGNLLVLISNLLS